MSETDQSNFGRARGETEIDIVKKKEKEKKRLGLK